MKITVCDICERKMPSHNTGHITKVVKGIQLDITVNYQEDEIDVCDKCILELVQGIETEDARNDKKPRIKIASCRDGHVWYAKHVGDIFPLLREEKDCYITREPSGFANVVFKEDAELV